MFVFGKFEVFCFLETRFEIRPFALLPAILLNTSVTRYVNLSCKHTISSFKCIFFIFRSNLDREPVLKVIFFYTVRITSSFANAYKPE